VRQDQRRDGAVVVGSEAGLNDGLVSRRPRGHRTRHGHRILPVTGWTAQLRTATGPRARLVTAFFGIRGIGLLFYLAYALRRDDFSRLDQQIWAAVTFAVLGSMVIHGIAATPVISHSTGCARRAVPLLGALPGETGPFGPYGAGASRGWKTVISLVLPSTSR
jgi:hypothetical protein